MGCKEEQALSSREDLRIEMAFSKGVMLNKCLLALCDGQRRRMEVRSWKGLLWVKEREVDDKGSWGLGGMRAR